MGAVHSTSGREVEALKTELAAAKHSTENIQAQLLAEREAAKESTEAGEARFKAQPGNARPSAVAADTEIDDSKKRFQELFKEHERIKSEHQELQSALSRLLNSHAKERAAFEDYRQHSNKTIDDATTALRESKELTDYQSQVLEQRKIMIRDLSKDLHDAQTKLEKTLRSSIQSNEERILMLKANNKALEERDESVREMAETIRVLKGVVEEQKGVIEELRKKTKPYWVFDESRY